MKNMILITAMLIAFVNCGDEGEDKQTLMEKVIEASNNPADGGTPTISDLKAIGLTEVRDYLQIPYEEAIAIENEKTAITTLQQLQAIITTVNTYAQEEGSICSNISNAEKLQGYEENTIIGTWKAVQRVTHNDIPPFNTYVSDIVNGYTIIFNEDFSYEGDAHSSLQQDECTNGKRMGVFEIIEEFIYITINNCGELGGNGNFIKSYQFCGEHLFLNSGFGGVIYKK